MKNTEYDSREIPLKCDVCGKFISRKELKSGKARRKLITPDSAFSCEEYETLCEKHLAEQKQWEGK